MEIIRRVMTKNCTRLTSLSLSNAWLFNSIRDIENYEVAINNNDLRYFRHGKLGSKLNEELVVKR